MILMSIHGPRLLGTQGRPGFGTLGAKTKKAPGKLGTVKVTVATNRGYSSELDRNHPCLPPAVSPMGTRTGIQRGNWTGGGVWYRLIAQACRMLAICFS